MGDNVEFADGIRTFVAVVEAGSFTAGAQRLGISNKLAGKQVAALEARLGRSLLYRTTRALSLTEDGERWLPHAREVLAALDQAEAALHDPGRSLSGRLRITAGTTLGELCLADAARSFVTENPQVRVEMVLNDGLTDLVAGGFDLAVRIGIPRDSSLKMQRIGRTTPAIAASPDYLARHGTPQRPADLEGHQAIIDLNEETPGRWPLRDGAAEVVIAMQGQLSVNSAAIAIGEAIRGHGLVRAPDIFLAPYLASGALVPLLTESRLGERPINLLTQPTAFRQRKIAAFATVLRRHLDALA
ncbi:LysR family transcriptional regulator [Paracoccus sp. M683]|uniref:LysR family transcriptional regulator n=1 Tax=Paracoccus sp. M683 TaxID=2594268 RepID=UPI00117F1392|nr:LysR family transcriptional regulator [Paracoccus sp. M683]TRW99226.1 LysR family transcriptional regulator [Paracoccus sp. M683]